MIDERDEEFGRLVRETWIRWAQEQPDVDEHPNWLTPWDGLTAREKEVDLRIARAVRLRDRAIRD